MLSFSPQQSVDSDAMPAPEQPWGVSFDDLRIVDQLTVSQPGLPGQHITLSPHDLTPRMLLSMPVHYLLSLPQQLDRYRLHQAAQAMLAAYPALGSR